MFTAKLLYNFLRLFAYAEFSTLIEVVCIQCFIADMSWSFSGSCVFTTFKFLPICFSKNSLNLASSSFKSNVIRRILFSFSSFLWFSRSRVSESFFSHYSLNFLKSASMSIEDIPVPNASAG